MPGVGRPNVLYVFGDQHRACSMPGQPLSPITAPNFAAFARSGFVMENCISNYPLCTPHRGMLISGRWPQQTGMVHNGPTIALAPSEHGLGQAFQSAGYHTMYVGKWHLYYGESRFVPPGPLRFGFEDWHAWGNTNKHYDDFTWDPSSGERMTVPGWVPTGMTDQAVNLVRKNKSAGKPWMMVVSWNPPHPPFNPPAEFQGLYTGAGLSFRPNVKLSGTGGYNDPRPQLQSEEALRQAERGYYGGISGIDREFKRLLDVLEETGQTQNTIVVYTADHGEMMGSHNRMAKQVPWEESCHVPFYIRVPGAGNHGGSSPDLIGSIDIYPTLCGLAGIPVPPSCVGRDLSGTILGWHGTPGDYIILMNFHNGDSNNPEALGFRGVRTRTHTYAVAEDGRWLLYNNTVDPYQMKNLVDDPAQKALMRSLDGLIFAWQKSSGDAFPLPMLAQQRSKQLG